MQELGMGRYDTCMLGSPSVTASPTATPTEPGHGGQHAGSGGHNLSQAMKLLDSREPSVPADRRRSRSSIPGPLQGEGQDVASILELVHHLIHEEEEEEEEESPHTQGQAVGEQAHMALLGHSLAAYENASAYFHEDDRDGLVRVCRLVLHARYEEYPSEGYGVLTAKQPVIYLSASCRPGLGQHLCSQLGLPLSSLCTVPCNTMFGSQHQMAASRGDSLTLTPGLWLGLPAVCAVTLYRHEDPALRPLEKLRALPLWLSLQYLGHSGIVQRIQHATALSQQLQQKLKPLTCIQTSDVLETMVSLEEALDMVEDELNSPVVLFKFSPDKSSGSEESSCPTDRDVLDTFNRWLGRSCLVCPILWVDVVDLEDEGACVRFSPLLTAAVLGTQPEDVQRLVDTLTDLLPLLSSTVTLRQDFREQALTHRPVLTYLEERGWAGLGAVRYEPETEGLDEERTSQQGAHINRQLLKRLQELDPDISFCSGPEDAETVCIYVGMVSDDVDVVQLLATIAAMGRDIDQSGRLLENMSEVVRRGIQEAEQQLQKASEEKLMEEGALRQLPIVGSVLNWFSPVQSSIKGRTFNLAAGSLDSTENTYSTRAQSGRTQAQDGPSSSHTLTGKEHLLRTVPAPPHTLTGKEHLLRTVPAPHTHSQVKNTCSGRSQLLTHTLTGKEHLLRTVPAPRTHSQDGPSSSHTLPGKEHLLRTVPAPHTHSQDGPSSSHTLTGKEHLLRTVPAPRTHSQVKNTCSGRSQLLLTHTHSSSHTLTGKEHLLRTVPAPHTHSQVKNTCSGRSQLLLTHSQDGPSSSSHTLTGKEHLLRTVPAPHTHSQVKNTCSGRVPAPHTHSQDGPSSSHTLTGKEHLLRTVPAPHTHSQVKNTCSGRSQLLTHTLTGKEHLLRTVPAPHTHSQVKNTCSGRSQLLTHTLTGKEHLLRTVPAPRTHTHSSSHTLTGKEHLLRTVPAPHTHSQVKNTCSGRSQLLLTHSQDGPSSSHTLTGKEHLLRTVPAPRTHSQDGPSSSHTLTGKEHLLRTVPAPHTHSQSFSSTIRPSCYRSVVQFNSQTLLLSLSRSVQQSDPPVIAQSFSSTVRPSCYRSVVQFNNQTLLLSLSRSVQQSDPPVIARSFSSTVRPSCYRSVVQFNNQTLLLSLSRSVQQSDPPVIAQSFSSTIRPSCYRSVVQFNSQTLLLSLSHSVQQSEDIPAFWCSHRPFSETSSVEPAEELNPSPGSSGSSSSPVGEQRDQQDQEESSTVQEETPQASADQLTEQTGR
ncbi:hypothetical protein WMY93_001901 [Mugilogobius chulae]|uniref:Pyridoxal-dependent decarboxylase domain-containing protein 1 n=1 Tax=Mugilogobius chulae TaxID=88201 RepID=A0AAW0PST2_9GOBI